MLRNTGPESPSVVRGHGRDTIRYAARRDTCICHNPLVAASAFARENSGNTLTSVLEAEGEAARSQCNAHKPFWHTMLKLARTTLLTHSILALGGSLIGIWLAEVLAALTERDPSSCFAPRPNRFPSCIAQPGTASLLSPEILAQTCLAKAWRMTDARPGTTWHGTRPL